MQRRRRGYKSLCLIFVVVVTITWILGGLLIGDQNGDANTHFSTRQTTSHLTNDTALTENHGPSFMVPHKLSAVDKEHFFNDVTIIDNDVNKKGNSQYSIRQEKLDSEKTMLMSFVYDASTYFLVNGIKTTSSTTTNLKTYGLLILQSMNDSPNDPPTYDKKGEFSYYNFVSLPNGGNKSLWITTATIITPSGGSNCFVVFLTNQYSDEKGNNLYYCQLREGENSDVVPFRNSSNTHYFAVADGVSSTVSSMNKLILAPKSIPSQNTKQNRELVVWTLGLKSTNLNNSTDDGDALQVTHMSVIPLIKSRHNVPHRDKTIWEGDTEQIISIQRDNFLHKGDKNNNNSIVNNFFFLCCGNIGSANQDSANKQSYWFINIPEQFSTQLSNTLLNNVYSFSEIINSTSPSMITLIVTKIRIDFLNNIWFSAVEKASNASSVARQEKLYFFHCLVGGKGVPVQSILTLMAVNPQQCITIPKDCVIYIKSLVGKQSFKIANPLKYDYSDSYFNFEHALSEARQLNLFSTLYFLAISPTNFKSVILEGDNLQWELTINSSNELDSSPLKNISVIDSIEQKSHIISIRELFVMQQQVYYTNNNNSLTLKSKTSSNRTTIFLHIEITPSTIDTDRSNETVPHHFLAWQFDSVDKIFTPHTDYNNWKNHNNFFNANNRYSQVQTGQFFPNTPSPSKPNYLQNWSKYGLGKNVFVAAGPFSICCDVSTIKGQQKITINDYTTMENGKKTPTTSVKTALNGGLILYLGAATTSNSPHLFTNPNDNLMTSDNNRFEVLVGDNYSYTTIYKGVSGINFSCLAKIDNGQQFFSSYSQSQHNNIGGNALVSMDVSKKNLFNLSPGYFGTRNNALGFYYFLNQNSVKLNFNGEFFNNNSATINRNSVTVAKIIEINKLIVDGKNISFVLPSTNESQDVHKIILDEQNAENNKYTLQYGVGGKSSTQIIKCNTKYVNNGDNFSQLAKMGLFLIEFTPGGSLNTANKTYILIQIGNSKLLSGFKNLIFYNVSANYFNDKIMYISLVVVVVLGLYCLLPLFWTKLSRKRWFNFTFIQTTPAQLTYSRSSTDKRPPPTNKNIKIDKQRDTMDTAADTRDEPQTLSSFYDDEDEAHIAE